MRLIGHDFMDKDKRFFRQLKRDIKRAGVKSQRQRLKRRLVEAPDEAAFDEIDYGRRSSAGLNGMDRDATRQRDGQKSNDADDDK